MPRNQKSAADQVAEAKAKAAGIPYVKRSLEDLENGKAYNAPNKPIDPPAKHERDAAQNELTGQPEATPKASSVVSDKQRAANKANAQNSTGPRTPEGKARVSTNALKHGLRSERNSLDISTAIPGEQTQFEATLTGFRARFQPDDEVELHLVQRLAQLTLRLNRAAQMETALTDQAHTSATEWVDDHPSHFPDPAQHPTEILAGTWTRSAKEAILLSQYESRLSHDFARTLRQLLQLQKLRKQTQPPLKTIPARSLASNGQIANLTEGPQPSTPDPHSPGPQSSNHPQPPSEIPAERTQSAQRPSQPPAISDQTNPTSPNPPANQICSSDSPMNAREWQL